MKVFFIGSYTLVKKKRFWNTKLFKEMFKIFSFVLNVRFYETTKRSFFKFLREIWAKAYFKIFSKKFFRLQYLFFIIKNIFKVLVQSLTGTRFTDHDWFPHGHFNVFILVSLRDSHKYRLGMTAIQFLIWELRIKSRFGKRIEKTVREKRINQPRHLKTIKILQNSNQTSFDLTKNISTYLITIFSVVRLLMWFWRLFGTIFST